MSFDKKLLIEQFKGKSWETLPTPSLVLDVDRFKTNCDNLTACANKLKVPLRCHVKTHKTTEGLKLQLANQEHGGGRVLVSTIPEARAILPLVKEGIVKDVCYSIPIPKLRLADCEELAQEIPDFRLLVDDIAQLDLLGKSKQTWSVFVKIDMGYGRAGLTPESPRLLEVFKKIKSYDNINLFGLYCHSGSAYTALNKDEAREYLFKEVSVATKAARIARTAGFEDLTLSVGSTPTAHAFEILDDGNLPPVEGHLEIHAGNYPCCDLQQVATGCVSLEQVAVLVVAEIVSTYPGRGTGPGEQLIDAGVLSLARETSKIAGYGKLADNDDWIVGRISQEHGILITENEKAQFLEYGTKIKILPQHACISCASFPYYFVLKDGKVDDVWVPAKWW